MTREPITLEEAHALGLTRGQLRGPGWLRLGHKVYARREVADDPLVKLKAAMRRLPSVAAFSGRTAAFLHGFDTRLIAVEATISPPTATAHVVGITIRRARIAHDEVVRRYGLRVTSLLRTAVDIACCADLTEAVVALDAAMQRGLERHHLVNWVTAHPGHRGIRRLRRAIELAEPLTESPMETRLRMALVLAGLPKPEVQTALPDAFARADLYYPEHRVVIEYDGAIHRDRLGADDRRQNRLVDAGYRILRFTASDVLGQPSEVVALVRRALSPPEHIYKDARVR